MSRINTILIFAALIIVGGVGYYALSPLFNTIEINEELPENIIVETEEPDAEAVPSGEENLSPEEREEMQRLTEEANAEKTVPMDERMPQTAEASGDASTVMGTIGHPAEGTVRVIQTTEGPVVRYENFKTINGPNLHVYLAKDLRANDFIDLGPIKGTEGNINYEIPDDVDLSEYRYIMYWCVPFGVLFNYADIDL